MNPLVAFQKEYELFEPTHPLFFFSDKMTIYVQVFRSFMKHRVFAKYELPPDYHSITKSISHIVDSMALYSPSAVTWKLYSVFLSSKRFKHLPKIYNTLLNISLYLNKPPNLSHRKHLTASHNLRKKQTQRQIGLQIPQNMLCRLPMNLFRPLHMLT